MEDCLGCWPIKCAEELNTCETTSDSWSEEHTCVHQNKQSAVQTVTVRAIKLQLSAASVLLYYYTVFNMRVSGERPISWVHSESEESEKLRVNPASLTAACRPSASLLAWKSDRRQSVAFNFLPHTPATHLHNMHTQQSDWTGADNEVAGQPISCRFLWRALFTNWETSTMTDQHTLQL